MKGKHEICNTGDSAGGPLSFKTSVVFEKWLDSASNFTVTSKETIDHSQFLGAVGVEITPDTEFEECHNA